MISEQYFIRM